MLTVNVHDAKTHLSKLLDRIARGESLVIARAGRPVTTMAPMRLVTEDQAVARYAGLVEPV